MTDASGTHSDFSPRVEPIGWSSLRHLVEEQDRGRLVLFMEGQSRVLQMTARGLPPSTVLDALLRVLELQVDDMACSVHLLSEDRVRLRLCAAPSLPERLIRALDGIEVGPRSGSIGTAVYLSS